MIFTDAEREYLHRTMLGRLSTIGPDGAPQNRPVAFRVNDDDTIDIGGPANATTRKYKNIAEPAGGLTRGRRHDPGGA